MKLSTYGKNQRKLRQAGWDDFHAGKSITDFPGHGERERAVWEIGWRVAKDGDPRPYSEHRLT